MLFRSPLDGCGAFQGPVGDSYSGGNLFFDSRPNAIGVWVCVCEFAGDRFDMPFQTVVAPLIEEVRIDVKPGSAKNLIRVHSDRIIPVAILGTPTFDVSSVDVSSVRFGPGAASAARGHGHRKDVNRDGLPDLVLYFRIRESGIQAGDTQVVLSGMTLGGEGFRDSDQIVTVGNKRSFPRHK